MSQREQTVIEDWWGRSFAIHILNPTPNQFLLETTLLRKVIPRLAILLFILNLKRAKVLNTVTTLLALFLVGVKQDKVSVNFQV